MFFKVDVPKLTFLASTFVVIALVLLIFFYLLSTAFPVLSREGVELFTGTSWDYETGEYGIAPFIIGTLVVTVITLVMIVPIGIFTAVYLAEIAPRWIVSIINPLIELLVGIPSIVFGLFGYYVLQFSFRDHITPWIHSYLGWIPLFSSKDSATGTGVLLASLVLAVMVLPTIVALSREAMISVPFAFREASYAMGATRQETIFHVILPAAFPGIVTSVVLAGMRAMGETMALVMLIGNVPAIPTSLLDKGATLTTKILTDIGYYISMDEPRAALFSVAVVLFLLEVTFVASLRFITAHWRTRY